MFDFFLGRSAGAKTPSAPKASPPMMQQPTFMDQMQQRYGNQLLSQTMNETAREVVSAGFGQDSLAYYDLWKNRNDPKAMKKVMKARMHNMDGGLQ